MAFSVSRRGFSLLELLVTVVVASIVVAIARPAVRIGASRSEAVATAVASTLSQAARLAVLRQHDVLVSFDTVGHRIRLAEDRNNDGVVSTFERRVWHVVSAEGRYRRGPVSLPGNTGDAAVAGANLATVDGTPRVVFRRDGSTRRTVRVYVGDRRRDAQFARAVQVSAASGQIDVYRWQTTTSRWRRVLE